MEIQEYFKKKKAFYNALLNFIDSGEFQNEDEFNKLTVLIKSHEIEPVISLILNIANNHHRKEGFFNKIENILLNLEKDIKERYSNQELFDIFINNKRILLFFINKKIISIDDYVKKMLLSMLEKNGTQYCHFFLSEIKGITDEETFKKIEDQLTEQERKNYEEKRLKGENDTYICEMIRNDSIDEFVEYMTRANISLSSQIEESIFETNAFLNENNPTLIEYAAFYGSIQIFNYLRMNEVELTPSLWLFVIHSKNEEIIYILENEKVDPPNKTFETCLNESIKCHHNEIADYIINNLIEDSRKIKKNTESFVEISFKYYNYEYYPEEMNENFLFFYLAQYNYEYIVDRWLLNKMEELEEKAKQI
ncbi:hypothetical protein M9Y10_019707 [Tritrichomonas musculus]|uniref:DUF3447 domain-containing protein n=1 Tax=Tritrichomonas musculus TaxID=1915356 RepID=A0ABR2HHZ4_9EUKA